MFAITGITGQVGSQVARSLLAAGHRVRAIVRSAEKGAGWAARGCEVAIVPDAADADALAAALAHATGAFLMNPPNYDPEPGFPDTWRVAEAYARAVTQARPDRLVVLSSVGAQVDRFNLLNNAGILEHVVGQTGIPVACLRPAWFLENVAWDVAGARRGRIESFLQPLDRKFDMVSVGDIGRIAAGLLSETWQGVRVVELAGPCRMSPNDLAEGLAVALGHPVRVIAVPCDSWTLRFQAEGMQHPEARVAMLEGFNEGWLDFERSGVEQQTGRVTPDAVLRALAAAA